MRISAIPSILSAAILDNRRLIRSPSLITGNHDAPRALPAEPKRRIESGHLPGVTNIRSNIRKHRPITAVHLRQAFRTAALAGAAPLAVLLVLAAKARLASAPVHTAYAR